MRIEASYTNLMCPAWSGRPSHGRGARHRAAHVGQRPLPGLREPPEPGTARGGCTDCSQAHLKLRPQGLPTRSLSYSPAQRWRSRSPQRSGQPEFNGCQWVCWTPNPVDTIQYNLGAAGLRYLIFGIHVYLTKGPDATVNGVGRLFCSAFLSIHPSPSQLTVDPSSPYSYKTIQKSLAPGISLCVSITSAPCLIHIPTVAYQVSVKHLPVPSPVRCHVV